MLTYNDNVAEGVYTLSDLLAAVKAPPACADNASAMRDWLDRDDHRWMGIDGDKRDGENHLDTTARLVREGWRKGVDLIGKVADKVNVPVPRSVRRVQRWQSQGDHVDMQRVWAGDLERAWRGMSRAERTGPRRIRILVDSIASGYVDAEEMRWRGVAALKLADVLVEAGYSVQVESVINTNVYGTNKRLKLRAIVKEYTAPLDLQTLAATTALPAFFRSIIHTWGLNVANYKRDGVGLSVQSPAPEDFPDGDAARVVMLPRTIASADDASRTITEIVNKLDEAGE